MNGNAPERGEIWWANLPEPRRSEPGYRRPTLVIQSNDFNQSGIATIIVAAITTNLTRAQLPGNVLIPRRLSGLPNDSVVNVSQLYTVDRQFLTDYAGSLPGRAQTLVDEGLRLVLGL